MKFLHIGSFFFIFLLFSFQADAQDLDGYIILTGNSYKYGTIRIDNSTENEFCFFKISGKAEFIKYKADAIMGYGVINGIRYSSYPIQDGSLTKNVFLKNESSGEINLFSFNGVRFFIEAGELMELQSSGIPSYKEILLDKMQKCKLIKSRIKSTKLTLGSLKKLFLQYNRCTSESIVLEPNVRVQTDFLVGVELNSTSPHFDFAQYTAMNNQNLTDRTLLSAGVNVGFSFKRVKNLAYVIGAFYYKQNFYTLRHTTHQSFIFTDKLDFNYNEIVIPLSLQYSFFKKERRIMPYLKVGVAIPITMKSNLTWQNETEDTDHVYFNNYNLPQTFNQSFQPGISAGSTFSIFKNIKNVMEFGYQLTGGQFKSNTTGVTVNGNRFTILFGFRI